MRPYTSRRGSSWSKMEDDILRALALHSDIPWSEIARRLPGRSHAACKRRYKTIMRSESSQLTEEDNLFLMALRNYYSLSWTEIANSMPGTPRKSAWYKRRFRFLEDQSSEASWMPKEDTLLLTHHKTLPWCRIAEELPGRTPFSCQRRWIKLLFRPMLYWALPTFLIISSSTRFLGVGDC
ncbi:hypothetical protein B0T16DRAFT_413193 [Cercophora newfieldiana]|uniref:Uncharacterized protein n=1 Tax=Cercophora newfieldiana TaxID=92897 RepID=A0AA40CR18_9PEZI|nr:hypothetical protein B0T16DRAFT_413193 [Cercophora newfieldiana]